MGTVNVALEVGAERGYGGLLRGRPFSARG